MARNWLATGASYGRNDDGEVRAQREKTGLADVSAEERVVMLMTTKLCDARMLFGARRKWLDRRPRRVGPSFRQ